MPAKNALLQALVHEIRVSLQLSCLRVEQGGSVVPRVGTCGLVAGPLASRLSLAWSATTPATILRGRERPPPCGSLVIVPVVLPGNQLHQPQVRAVVMDLLLLGHCGSSPSGGGT
jgi:hypothetical protein